VFAGGMGINQRIHKGFGNFMMYRALRCTLGKFPDWRQTAQLNADANCALSRGWRLRAGFRMSSYVF
jgi:hypothetical protein